MSGIPYNPKAPRGVRNRNPGNIEISHIPWQGKSAPNSDGKFEQFTTDFFGVRALARNLHTYFVEGKDTVTKIISPYAPPNENNTTAYIASVCKLAGVGPDDRLNLEDPTQLRAVTQGIVRVECGAPDVNYGAYSTTQWYGDELVASAVKSALGL